MWRSCGQPFVIPVAYAPWRDRLVFHGSTGSRLFRTLAGGAATCLTVTLLDGLVLARSAFESSMHYRGVMVLGQCTVLTGDDKADALKTISDHLLPGRWESIRHPSNKEDAATMVVSLPLDEWSVKIGEGFAETMEDLAPDTFGGVWGGVVPLVTSFGTPLPDEFSAGLEVPAHVREWLRQSSSAPTSLWWSVNGPGTPLAPLVDDAELRRGHRGRWLHGTMDGLLPDADGT